MAQPFFAKLLTKQLSKEEQEKVTGGVTMKWPSDRDEEWSPSPR